ncbi:MAG: adenylate kinase [Treponema sp.]|nr:adenylate kinase [Treponema sp.]
MIIIITGASHTGKTLLAQRMLEKYKFPYLSIDHLKMGLIRSGNTKLTPEDDEQLTTYLWPILRDISFICLAMTEKYIDAHFDEIKNHASDIEARLDDSDCTAAWIKAENNRIIKGFESAGELIDLIDSSYEQIILKILQQ